MAKTAVVLFNLGGPDRPESVRPFLFNLFNDPAIIRLPAMLRWPLAQLIAARRAPLARAIYAHLGGGSPLLANTEAQAQALSEKLSDRGQYRVFIAMRYWHPTSDETAREVAGFGPDRVVLLPLYPQFSTTTTGSSIAEWRRTAARAGLQARTRALCCYPTAPGFVGAIAGLVRTALAAPPPGVRLRVLFSAHGLPKRVVAGGDPYQWQVEKTAAAVAEALGIAGLDWVVCYQSRVGPLEWIGPATDAEIARAGREGIGVVIVPIAFVSEHSETLVELDVEYRKLAKLAGVPYFSRTPTVGTQEPFIAALADLVVEAAAADTDLCRRSGETRCPGEFGACPHRAAARAAA